MSTEEVAGPRRGLQPENLPPRGVESSWWSARLTTLSVNAQVALVGSAVSEWASGVQPGKEQRWPKGALEIRHASRSQQESARRRLTRKMHQGENSVPRCSEEALAGPQRALQDCRRRREESASRAGAASSRMRGERWVVTGGGYTRSRRRCALPVLTINPDKLGDRFVQRDGAP